MPSTPNQTPSNSRDLNPPNIPSPRPKTSKGPKKKDRKSPRPNGGTAASSELEELSARMKIFLVFYSMFSTRHGTVQASKVFIGPFKLGFGEAGMLRSGLSGFSILVGLRLEL